MEQIKFGFVPPEPKDRMAQIRKATDDVVSITKTVILVFLTIVILGGALLP